MFSFCVVRHVYLFLTGFFSFLFCFKPQHIGYIPKVPSLSSLVLFSHLNMQSLWNLFLSKVGFNSISFHEDSQM